MKVVTAHEMGRIEKLAYAAGASEEKFMLAAGEGVAQAVLKLVAELHLKPHVLLLCGSGNNAGDAYVAGRVLLESGFAVKALALAPYEKSTPLCQLQSDRFKHEDGKIEYINSIEAVTWGDAQLLVDGILGTGFHGEVTGLFKQVIEKANESGLPILSIDIPSGMDGSTGAIGGVAIRATETVFLGLPKTGCLSQDVWDWVGKVRVHDFGLDKSIVDQAEADYYLIDDDMISSYLPKIKRTRHKYQSGYVVGLGGSPGMPGAPIMSSYAALRAGAGIVLLLHRAGMEAELSSAPCEIIRQAYSEKDSPAILAAMEKAKAVFIGPGLGLSAAALNTLEAVLPHLNKPCVIDAAALTLLAEHDIPLPPQTILTPHQAEMKRLLHVPKDIPYKELFALSQEFTDRKKVILVLKGAPTFILSPGGKPYVCVRGDPGMATAGSGDVLTGIIAAFLSQTGDPLRAAILGVQFHSIAGELAAAELTSYCMNATDITRELPKVFKQYLNRGLLGQVPVNEMAEASF